MYPSDLLISYGLPYVCMKSYQNGEMKTNKAVWQISDRSHLHLRTKPKVLILFAAAIFNYGS